MGMLGNQLAAGQALTVANDSFNGDGSTTAFTLSQTVSNVNDIEVLVDNVQQSPYDSSYSVSGTTLTFSGAPSAGTNNVYVIYNASKHIATSQVIPDDGSVTHSKLHTTALNPITLDQTNNTVGIGTTTNTTHSLYLHDSGFRQLAMSGNRPTIFMKETDSNANENFQIRVQDGELRFEQQNDAQSAASTKVAVTQEGYVKMSNVPAWGVTRTAGHVSSGNYIIYNDTNYNQGNHYDTTTGRFTAPVNGFYQVNIWHMTDNNTTHTNKYFEVRINSSLFKRCYSTSSGSAHHQFSWTGTIYLNASDHISVYNASIGNLYATGAAYSYFSGFLVG